MDESMEHVVEGRDCSLITHASRHLSLTFRPSTKDDNRRRPARYAALDIGFDYSKLVTCGLSDPLAAALFEQVEHHLLAEPRGRPAGRV